MTEMLTRVEKGQDGASTTRKGRIWRECPLSHDVIFEAIDDCGRSGWFLRLTVSGLYPRRVGPYRTMEQALDVLEDFLDEVDEACCNLQSAMTPSQVYVVEGVPPLVGPCAGLSTPEQA